MERNQYLNNKLVSRFLVAMFITALADQITTLLIPVIAGNFVSQAGITVINLYHPVEELFYAITMLLSVGASLLAAHAIGHNDKKRAGKHFAASIISVSFITLLLAVLVYIFSGNIVHALTDGRNELKNLLLDFINIVIWSVPLKALSITTGLFLAMDGQPKRVAAAALSSSIIAVITAFISVKYFNLGIQGIGLAFIIKEIVSLVILTPYIYHKECAFKPKMKKGEYFKYLWENMERGGGHVLDDLSFVFSLLILNSTILKVAGEPGAVLWSVVITIVEVASLLCMAIQKANMALGEVQFGENDIHGLEQTIKRSKRVLYIAVSVLFAVLFLAPELIMNIYGVQIDKESGLSILNIRQAAPAVLFYAFGFFEGNCFNVIEKEKDYLLCNILTSLIPVACILLFAHFAPQYIWFSFVISLILEQALLFFMRRRFKHTLANESRAIESCEFSLKYNFDSTGNALETASSFLHRCNIQEDIVLKVEHCIDELSYNIIKHRPHKLHEKSFDIRIVCLSDCVELFFKDAGRPFCPVIEFHDSAADAVEGGQKLQLALRMFNLYASDSSYRYINGLNVTRLKFPKNEDL